MEIETDEALTPDIVEFSQAYRLLRNHGTWPDAPILMDNTASFVESVALMDGRMDKIELEMEEQRRRDAKVGRRL